MKKQKKNKKASRKKEAGVKKGDRLVCQECGFSVIVDDSCGCEESHELICCDEPMVFE